MKANEAPDKIYIQEPTKVRIDKKYDNDVEYTRTDAFIEKACEYFYNYNKKQVLKHGAKAILGCGEYTINVEDFKNYMKGGW